MDIVYIFSQVCVLIYYLLVISTYQIKERKTILCLNMIAMAVMGISYFCLAAYSGLAMVVLGLVRNVMFFVDEITGKTSDKITKRNVGELCILIVMAIGFSFLTYEGPLSLMSVVATMTYTVSIWQKNTKVYRVLGIPIGVAGITYNAYIKSVLGVIFEVLSLISAVVGYLRLLVTK